MLERRGPLPSDSISRCAGEQRLETGEWERIKSLFYAALEMRPAARLRFLAQGGDSPHIRECVERLLLAHESANSFLSRNAALEDAGEPAADPPRLLEGALLVERFQILRFIARGGMGEVYEARDVELHSRVAIKIIRPEIAVIPSALARFKREVQFARQVTHPNVCRIFDIFRQRDPLSTANDVVFVSMELLSGVTLAQRLQQSGAIGEKETLLIVRQVLAALAAAHAAGVLHRDLKPGNILLEPGREGNPRAVITDFGLARSLELGSETPLSISGQPAFGTPEYMSPEQIEGKPLTPASDLYSLGLVVYRMLTGSRAVPADTPFLSALRRIHESPPPPSRIAAGLDKRWDRILARCLAPDPLHRFGTAAEMLAAVDEIGSPVAATSVRRYAVASWFGRRWRWLTGGLTLVLAIAGAIERHRTKPSVPTSISYVLADFVNATGEPIFDKTLNLALAAKLRQTPYLDRVTDTRIHAALGMLGLPSNERLTQNVAMQVCRRLEGAALLQGEITNGAAGYVVTLRAMQCRNGKVLVTRQATAEGQESVLEALDRAADGIRQSLGEPAASIQRYDVPLWQATTPSLDALTAFADGYAAWNAQGAAAALPHFERAVRIDPAFALAWARLGTAYGNLGETQRSNEALRKAFELRNHVTEWERYYIDSHYYAFVTGEIDKEMQSYEQWAAAYPHDRTWTINLSIDYSIEGDYDRAIALLRRAVREAPGNAPSYGNLARLYLAIDHPDEAREILDAADRSQLSDGSIELARYWLAFYAGDTAQMKKLVTAGARRVGIEDTLLAQQAATEDREGRLTAGLTGSNKAAEIARQTGDREASANWLAMEAMRQAELGARDTSRRLAAQALAVPKATRGADVEVLAAYAAAMNGDRRQAEQLLRDGLRDYPLDSIVQHYWAPILRARIALSSGKADQAIQDLAGTEAYDLGIFEPGQCMDAAYLRGEAFSMEQKPSQAADQFRNILEHRGLVLNCPTSALARLGLARALARAGDTDGSREAYQDLLALWKNADKGFRMRGQALAEYRALHGESTSPNAAHRSNFAEPSIPTGMRSPTMPETLRSEGEMP